VSPNGSYVAVGSGEMVSIYAINNPRAQPKEIMLSNQTTQSQKVNFSSDSNKVVIVTRRTNGQMELILLELIFQGHGNLEWVEIWPRKPIDYGEIVSPKP
jgi:hypothetical protein